MLFPSFGTRLVESFIECNFPLLEGDCLKSFIECNFPLLEGDWLQGAAGPDLISWLDGWLLRWKKGAGEGDAKQIPNDKYRNQFRSAISW